MKKIFLILIANFCLGASLMQYDLFNHDDSVDIALAFDSAYKPDIVRRVDGQSMSLILKGLGGDEKFNEMRTNQKVLKGFTITPKGKDVEVNFPTGADLSVDALAQDGNLKLVLRVKNPAFDQSKMSVKSDASEAASGKSNSLGRIMPILVAILFIVAAIVFVRRILMRRPKKSIDETWRVFEDEDAASDLGGAGVLSSSESSDDAGLLGGSDKSCAGSCDDAEPLQNAHDDFYDEILRAEQLEDESSKFKEGSGGENFKANSQKTGFESGALNSAGANSEFADEISRSLHESDKISPSKNEAGDASFVLSGAEKVRSADEAKDGAGAKELEISAFKRVLQDEILTADALAPSDVKVEFVKGIDERNTAVVLSFGGKKHLVVLKSSNAIE